MWAHLIREMRYNDSGGTEASNMAGAAEQLSCINSSCGRPFERALAYCPYCGQPQKIEKKPPPPTAAPAQQPTSPNPDAQPPKTEKRESAPTPLSKPTMPAPPPRAAAAPPPAPGKKSSHLFLIAGAVAAAALVTFLLWPRSGTKDSAVTTVGAQWAALDLSQFPNGAHVVVSGDGAFRLRSASTPPILVEGNNPAIALGTIHRLGLEAKSVSQNPVRISVSAAE